MWLYAGAVLSGLLLLAWSSERFVDGAGGLARLGNISPLVIGMVVIGFGTSAPELLVSVMAAFNGVPGIALGNAVGSNITNIALILGGTAILTALPVHSGLVRRELPVLIGIALFSWLLAADGRLGRLDGLVMLLVLVVVLAWLVLSAHDQPQAADKTLHTRELSWWSAGFMTAGGLLLLLLSSRLLVWGASGIATSLGVSDLIIGLTIVAIGTSLPELAASLSAARRGSTDLAVGNIVGSNLFNNLGVMGLAAFIHPLYTPDALLTRDIPVMLGLTVLLLVFTFTPPQRKMITRSKGSMLLILFLGYQGLLYFQSH